MKKPLFKATYYAVTWYEGATEEYKGEGDGRVYDYEPICCETQTEFKFTYKGRPGTFGSAAAIFPSKAEAESWAKAADYDKYFIVRPVKIEVY